MEQFVATAGLIPLICLPRRFYTRCWQKFFVFFKNLDIQISVPRWTPFRNDLILENSKKKWPPGTQFFDPDALGDPNCFASNSPKLCVEAPLDAQNHETSNWSFKLAKEILIFVSSRLIICDFTHLKIETPTPSPW